MNLETKQEQDDAIYATIKRHELRHHFVHCEKVKWQKHIERIRELNALKNLVRTNDTEHSVEVTVEKRDFNSIGDYIKGDRKTRFLILSFGMRGRELPSSA